MENSVAASAQGLMTIDRSRKRLGWNRQSTVWAQQALTSVATLKQFWRRERVSRETFMRICAAVGETNWEAIAELSTPGAAHPVGEIDWGEAPEVSHFQGRGTELATLQTWLVEERCKLISILGMGGMGKTTLSVQLAEQMRSHFSQILWRSLRNAPPLCELGYQLLRSLNLLQDQPFSVDHLLKALRDRRCLLILDNLESILTTPAGEGKFQPGYEDYGELLRRIGEERHQSCLVLTSREAPRTMARLVEEKVRSLSLGGVSAGVGNEILQRVGGLPTGDYREIVHHYAGNPLALKIVAAGIRDVLNHDIATFLDLLHQGTLIFSDFQDLLARHYDRLSDREQEVVIWLAIAREPILVSRLQDLLLSPDSKVQFSATLESLKRRLILEVTPMGYTLQPAVMEYVMRRFLEQVCHGLHLLLRSPLDSVEKLLRFHPLLIANAKDFIRDAQKRLLIEPVIDFLQACFETQEELHETLLKQLQSFKGKPIQRVGYLGGTLFNLLTQLQPEWRSIDLSHLVLWQADLRPAKLHGVDLSESDLQQCALTDLFGVVLSVACHPQEPIIAYGDDRGWVHLWQTSTGQQIQSFLAHPHWIFSLQFSPDGAAIACGSLDRTVSVWDWQTGTQLQHFAFHTEGVGAIAFHPQATATQGLLTSSGSDQTIHLIDLQTGQLQQVLTGHQDIVPTIAFAPNGKWVASGSLDQHLKLWEIATGTCLQTWHCETPIHAIAFAPERLQHSDDETPWIAIAGEHSEITILNYQTGEFITLLSGHRDRVWSLALTHQGQLMSGSDDGTIRLWDWLTGDCLKILQGHQGRVWSIASHAQGEMVSGGEDRTVRLWAAQGNHCIDTLHGYHNATTPVAWGDREFFTFSADQRLRRWAIEDSTCLQTQPLPTKNSMTAALNPTLTQVACAGLDGTIQICRLEDGAVMATLFGHPTWVRDLVFSPDGSQLASASGDRTIRLWNVNQGICLQTLEGHQNPVQAIAFHPTGQWLVSGGWDQQIKCWDLRSGTCVQTLGHHRYRINSVVFTPAGDRLFSAGADGVILQWAMRRKAKQDPFQLQSQLAEIPASIVSIALHPTQAYLASISQDNQLRLWNLQTGQCQITLPVAIAYSSQLCFSPQGDWLAVGTDDSTCLLFKTEILLTPVSELQPSSKNNSFVALPYYYRIPRPYENTNIRQVTGLTPAQFSTFQALGALLNADF
ncbi:MAG: NB-ARC domain-containing protein [Synechococcales bacterium]|nr:NB-ARC domain-containing protein [Synechococcales bacterium]